jgi:hypothetical protein
MQNIYKDGRKMEIKALCVREIRQIRIKQRKKSKLLGILPGFGAHDSGFARIQSDYARLFKRNIFVPVSEFRETPSAAKWSV